MKTSSALSAAPGIEDVFSDSPNRRLEIGKAATIGARENGDHNRAGCRVQNPDVVRDDWRPISSLVSDGDPEADPLWEPGVVQLPLQNAAHLVRRRWRGEFSALELLQQPRGFPCRRAAEPLARVLGVGERFPQAVGKPSLIYLAVGELGILGVPGLPCTPEKLTNRGAKAGLMVAQ